MTVSFHVLNRASSKLRESIQLFPDNWDDYSFKTLFNISFIDINGSEIELGSIKIGFKDQSHGRTLDALLLSFKDQANEQTAQQLPLSFNELPDGWFSLGQDVGYYKKIHDLFPDNDQKFHILKSLKDIVFDNEIFAIAEQQHVFSDSLMRGVSRSSIFNQFNRVLNGGAELTDYNFEYQQDPNDRHAPVSLSFNVTAHSTPPTNIHVLIGRNGVGKTTLLNNMLNTLLGIKPEQQPSSHFLIKELISNTDMPKDYFSSVVSVSFSVFDPFIPPENRAQDPSIGPAYAYIGMKTRNNDSEEPHELKKRADLNNDFINSFKSCLSQPTKKSRWLSAIQRLESDINFADMGLGRLLDIGSYDQTINKAKKMIEKMSSGHSIVLLTITALVDIVEEKTLVLLDEPESHLHPPLLSAFTRALSDLLYSRNGVAIVATHSPVVLQEVPSSCVSKLSRIGLQGRIDRPERETFGENVGTLTREVFGLEVSKSGFHQMLIEDVEAGKTLEEILSKYDDKLGMEARSILLSQLAIRDAKKEQSNEMPPQP